MFRFLLQPDCATLILRLTLAAIFVTQGVAKVLWYDLGSSWYSDEPPIASALQAVVAWSELLFGILLGVGLLTRLSALAVVALMIGAVYYVAHFHGFTTLLEWHGAFSVRKVGYEYNYAIIAMCACLVILGGGLVSLDRLVFHRRAAEPMAARISPGPGALS